jgi:hypothetical protein
MKKFILLLVNVFICTTIFAQSQPPLGIRGTYVDCAQDLIYQIHIGNPFPALDFLDEMQSRNITYVALFGLDHNSNSAHFPNGYVIGDPAFEPDIFYFVNAAHARNIKVGIVISDKSFVQHTFTPRLNWRKLAVRTDCFPPDAMRIANVSQTSEGKELLLGEMAKAAVRIANYNSTLAYFGGYIDYISVEYEYWTSAFYTDHPAYSDDAVYSKEHYAYQDLLDLMNFIRRNVICSGKYGNLRSEMELRIKDFTSPLITVPDPQRQADEIDLTLVDRILLVDYHKNPNVLFGYNCDNLYWLGQPSGRSRTEILNLMSAESPAFPKVPCVNYPNTPLFWGDFLGNHLQTHMVTLADVENTWYTDLLAASSSSCTNCGCNFTNGDNQIGGFMWFTSSILINHNIFRKGEQNINVENQILIHYDDASKKLIIPDLENYESVNIFDFSGKLIYSGSIRGSIALDNLSQGIYFCSLTDKFNRFNSGKFIVL